MHLALYDRLLGKSSLRRLLPGDAADSLIKTVIREPMDQSMG